MSAQLKSNYAAGYHIGNAAFPLVALAALLIVIMWLALQAPIVDCLGVAGVAGLLLLNRRSRFLKGLDRRIRENEDTWASVMVNQVPVSLISDAHYAQILRNTIFDANLYVVQARNALSVAASFFSQCLRLGPFVAFWSVVLITFISPADISTAIDALQHSNVATLQHAMATSIRLLLGLVAVATLIVSAVDGDGVAASLGLVNYFDEAVKAQLRLQFKVTALGDITLSDIKLKNGHLVEQQVQS